MRWILLLGLVLFVGCNAPLTEDEARTVCDSTGASEATFNEGVDLAQNDEADGLSAAESMELFRGDCRDECDSTTDTCYVNCTTCADAIVRYVYND